ncbi:Na+/H+ antiporter subunit E [Streptomyces sp. NPDC048389]|uniref:Na+/H+ antiporter subunit E n=1 Tax=Streptomyces sp. NPDC048389 TaxID=3154622 RepID=UPI0034552EA6
MTGHGRRAGGRVLAVCWLWLLWAVLWGSLSPLVVTAGLVVALVVVVAFPLPPVLTPAGRRPVRIAGLVGRLAVDLVGSAATVAWEAVRYGGKTSAAIVEVPLRADTDLLVTTVANFSTLTPGTLVLEIDRRGQILYVHALPARGADGPERRRRDVRAVDRRVTRALGGGDGPAAPAVKEEP